MSVLQLAAAPSKTAKEGSSSSQTKYVELWTVRMVVTS